MSRYTITESVGSHVESVHRYEDLEKHHPSSGREPGRDYATIDGRLEEVRRVDGHTFVKKDMIFAVDNGGPVNIPAPANGYVHYLHDATNAVRIYDRPYGTPGATMLAQVLHMRPGTSPAEGARVDYGAPLGRMGDTGSPGSIHAHIEMEPAAFRRYIQDIEQGAITPDRHPPRGPSPAPGGDAMADGVLRRGEQGTPVRSLQKRLNDLGIHDAQGRAIPVDGDFGARTEEAVRNFQRTHGLEVDGVVGRDTFAALGRASQHPPPSGPSSPGGGGHYGPTPLSNLIGRGEGGYNSYNRGQAGDSGGAAIDFSQMTVGEIMRRQSLPHRDPQYLFAVGKFQMIPGTMRETVAHLHVDPSARFTPDLQERMFAEYLVSGKRPAVREYITGAGGAQALGSAQLALAQEFASVADPRTGRSYYDGDSAGNHSSISAREVQQALDRMRELYRANVARGLSPADAYAAIGGGAPTRGADTPASTAPTSPVLREGDRSDDVRRLQQALHDRGVTDASGRAVLIDGDFGACTGEAVRRFQRSQGLEADGVAGPDTWKALRAGPRAQLAPAGATSSSALNDPTHPDAALLRQAVNAMDRLEASIGRTHDAHTDRAATLMAVAAKREGLTSIDHVLLGDDGRRLFAVQGEIGSPTSRMAFVDTQQAMRQSVEESARQLAMVAQPGALPPIAATVPERDVPPLTRSLAV